MLTLVAFFAVLTFAVAGAVSVAGHARRYDRSILFWGAATLASTAIACAAALAVVRPVDLGDAGPDCVISLTTIGLTFGIPFAMSLLLTVRGPSTARFSDATVAMYLTSSAGRDGGACSLELGSNVLRIKGAHDGELPYEHISCMRVDGEALVIRDATGLAELAFVPLGGPDDRGYRRAMAGFVGGRIAARAPHLRAVPDQAR